MTGSAVVEKTLQRWKCVCAYHGAEFAGWQSQPGGLAIQDVIEARLQAVFHRLVRIHASGRTDAGVHARAQVFHFDAEWHHGAAKLKAAMRPGLPRGVQIRTVTPVSGDFHARFSASGKRYHYDLFLGDPDPFTRPFVWAYERSLNVDAMKEAAAVLQGEHDFRAFSAVNGAPKEDTVRDLRKLALSKRGRRLRVVAEADGFMYKMVRSLVGALVSVGEGKLTVSDIERLLKNPKRDPLVFTAPPQGLFLERVYYPAKGAQKKPRRASGFETDSEELGD